MAQQHHPYAYSGHPQDFSESTASLFSHHKGESRFDNAPNDDDYAAGRHAGQPGVVNGLGSYQQQQQTAKAQAPQQHAAAASMSVVDLAAATYEPKGDNVRVKGQPRVFKTAFGDFMWKDLWKRSMWKYWIGALVLIGALVAASHYHDDFIKWFEPHAETIRDIPAGFMIWVGILFVISFPPLFGHELICIVCGIIYPFWIACGIVALGTMLGEWGNYFVFRYACTARTKKMEETNVNFACIARVIREGGFWIAFWARLSALPGHLTTPAFAATGMSIWIFTITAIITMPKQLMAVYLGSIFGDEKPPGITAEKVFEWVVLGVTFIVTIWAAWFIYKRMAKVRPLVIAEREEKQIAAAALLNGGIPPLPGTGANDLTQSTSSSFSSPPKKQYRTSRHASGQRWPFASGNESKLEEGQVDASSPLVSKMAPPAGYGEDHHYESEQDPSRNYAGHGAGFASSSEVDLQQQHQQFNDDRRQTRQYPNAQQPLYDEQQYRRESVRQNQGRLLDPRQQPESHSTPENAPQSQQGEQDYNTSGRPYDRQSTQPNQRPITTAGQTQYHSGSANNAYYHSNPPASNNRRYHTGYDEGAESTQQMASPDQPSYPPSQGPPRYHSPYDERPNAQSRSHQYPQDNHYSNTVDPASQAGLRFPEPYDRSRQGRQ